MEVNADLAKLAHEVRAMRVAQKRYFRERNQYGDLRDSSNLECAKALEARLDAICDGILNPGLFAEQGWRDYLPTNETPGADH